MFRELICLLLRPAAALKSFAFDDYAQFIMCPRMPATIGFTPM